jgi:hypothetical protein
VPIAVSPLLRLAFEFSVGEIPQDVFRSSAAVAEVECIARRKELLPHGLVCGVRIVRDRIATLANRMRALLPPPSSRVPRSIRLWHGTTAEFGASSAFVQRIEKE